MGKTVLRCTECGKEKKIRDWENTLIYESFIDLVQQAFMDLDQKINAVRGEIPCPECKGTGLIVQRDIVGEFSTRRVGCSECDKTGKMYP